MPLANTIHDRMYEQTLPKRRGTKEARPTFNAGRIARPCAVVRQEPARLTRSQRLDRRAGRA